LVVAVVLLVIMEAVVAVVELFMQLVLH